MTSSEDYQRIPKSLARSLGQVDEAKGRCRPIDGFSGNPARTAASSECSLLFGNDYPSARDITLTAEPYALAAVLRDRANVNAQLYTQIQARLAAACGPVYSRELLKQSGDAAERARATAADIARETGAT